MKMTSHGLHVGANRGSPSSIDGIGMVFICKSLKTMILIKSIVVWCVFILAESLNGAIRLFWLVPFLGAIRAEQLSFLAGSILVLTIATLFIRWLQASRVSQQLGIGVLWMVLTLGFEIGLGYFIFGYSWQEITADFNLTHGGLMPVELVLLLLAPLIAASIRSGLTNLRITAAK
jgi:hypothetical protein